MIDPWLPIIRDLPLSNTEKEVLKRYENDPEGRSFLPVADILKAHNRKREGLEMLVQGVERHPGYTVARVVLSREYLNKGMVGQAWKVLEDSPHPIRDNLLAQKLRFRLGILLEFEDAVRATYEFLRMQQMLDAETKKIGDMLEISGLHAAKQKIINDFNRMGVTLDIPKREFFETQFNPANGPVRLAEQVPDNPGFLEESAAIILNETVGGFHVMPLNEVFRGESGAGGEPRAGQRQGNGELDSTTLADIYEKQGYYGKALGIYKRLLKTSPGNDRFKNKLRELTKLEREQRQNDFSVDPELVDKMETLEIIDRQIEFYQELMGRLER